MYKSTPLKHTHKTKNNNQLNHYSNGRNILTKHYNTCPFTNASQHIPGVEVAYKLHNTFLVY